MDKLTRRLRREVKAHPAKAAVLGLLFVVALWFWAPLVWGWVGGDGKKKGKDTTMAQSTAPSVNPPGAATPSTTSFGAAMPKEGPSPAGRVSWRRLAEQMDGDLRTRPTDRLPARAEPFRPAESVVAAAELKKEEVKAKENPEPVEPPSPEKLGLVLTTTIVGPDGGVALINGRSHRQGDKIVLSDNDNSIEFRLTAVDVRGIELKQGEKTYRVEVPRPSSGNIEIREVVQKEEGL